MSEKEETKVGVYICHCGGNISDIVDVEKVRQELEKYPNVVVSRRNMFMCSNAGQELIEEDIKAGKVNRVVVASCSPSLHEMTFRGATRRGGLNEFLYEQVNIREQDSWVHSHQPDEATRKAVSLIRGGVAKAMQLDPLESIKITTRKKALVLGGGVGGLRAAKELAASGIPVELVEKSPYLGGRMASLDTIYPTGEVAADLLNSLIQEIISNSLITLRLNTEVVEFTGYIGNFNVSLKEIGSRGIIGKLDPRELRIAANACPEIIPNEYDFRGIPRKAIGSAKPGNYPQIDSIDWNYCTRCGKCKEALENTERIQLEISESDLIHLTAGVVILATGFDHYIPYNGEFGWEVHPNVITLPQFVRMMSPGGIFEKKFEWHGREIHSVAIIHCVGSRQADGNFKPGQNCDGMLNEYCSRVCCSASLQAANEIKERFPETNVYNIYRDIRTYARFTEEDYYEKASKNGVIFLKYNSTSLPEVVKPSNSLRDRRVHIKVKDQLTFCQELEVPADLVILAVGMVPSNQKTLINQMKVPIGSDRFLLEVHPKLRPIEMASPGIMLAGTSQAPMDITETSAAASAAASKGAIILAKNFTELEPFVALVDPEICNGTGLCVNECEYMGAIQMVDTIINGVTIKHAQVNAALCKGCGACVAVCPTPGAIDVRGYKLGAIKEMIKAFVEDVKL
ncbi:MAG: CoB--CoM heterodisulfide reductase iron-sulfur subunit A family protein [Candidatus Heimdallarchaeota archaeon]|nr:CoB--CoM heterodisulfide reductase iron-sulfur subunit A family protein [Candidatus Heimdallarchaeota archaeon]